MTKIIIYDKILNRNTDTLRKSKGTERKMKNSTCEMLKGAAMMSLFAAVMAGGGIVMWYTGQYSAYTPMCMLALIMLAFAVLLLVNTYLPILYSVAENAGEKEGCKKVLRAMLLFFPKYGNVISLVINIAISAWYSYMFYLHAVFKGSLCNVSYLHVFITGMVFLGMLVCGMCAKHFVKDKEMRVSLSSIFSVLRLNVLVLTAGTVLTRTGVFDTFTFMRWFEIAMGAYSLFFIFVSVIGEFIRKELRYVAHIVIPLPLASEKSDENLVDYLEKNTGITLRSLFSIKYAKSILPVALFLCAVVFWLATGVTVIEPHEEGALYTLGKCEKVLEPGFHLTLPYPLSKVDVYDTGKIRETVVGYDSDKKGNILWNESHGGTEYKLLLGKGNELVSVNVRIQYRIDDLYEYISASKDPERILNAEAYWVVTDLTIGTTLDAIISEDRDELSEMMEQKLGEYLDRVKIGVEVADVIIESIHPPVEVAWIYQQAVSAELKAKSEKDRIEGVANSTLSYAALNRNAAIKGAEIEQLEKLAAANAEVSEFLAMVEANGAYPDAFKYYKYLDALTKVFSDQRLYILGEDIDEKYIYFGGEVVIYQ